MLRDRPGFQGYRAVDAGDGILPTISVFETEEAAGDSTAAAAGRVHEKVTAGATSGVMAEAPA